MTIDMVPAPRKVVSRRGELRLPCGSDEACVLISDERARASGELIAERFMAPIVSGQRAGDAPIRLTIVKDLEFARRLRADRRVEAYRLEVSGKGIALSALTGEGLLRGAATLFQTMRREDGQIIVPHIMIDDWPDFRYRCGSDWLLNVEVNRWAYDWGDGRQAFLDRVRRKLDFCFAHKINMVWFDGFGWDTKRFPGYAALMRACTDHARRLGIGLVFCGYGGGYGTAYQPGENYRCGYFGKVYRNCRPYPDGDEYDCCGFSSQNGWARYGTCLSNAPLRSAKLDEMKRFVSEVRPGFMYIHDIDGGDWRHVGEIWKHRCPECRKRWPNDELAGPEGQADAYASWFRQVRRELSALPTSDNYSPARDLVLIFTSPLYTAYDECTPENVWELEMEYFDRLSRRIGPEPGIEFGLREQFYDAGNRKKIGRLRSVLQRNGNGHGIHVIAFGGGDNYLSDDLTNVSGAMAHFYDGAESVCLSNGGLHEEPVQMLNADFLWSGTAGGYRENPANEAEAVAAFKKIAAGENRPLKVFAAGGVFERVCARQWGGEAGKWMSRALQTRRHGQMPVSRIWWSVTQTVSHLVNDEVFSWMSWNWDQQIEQWTDRGLATASALKCARRAEMISDDEDIHWFASCLEVGGQFAEAIRRLLLLLSGRDKTAGVKLARAIQGLRTHIRQNHDMRKADILGGDPGCWLETIERIEHLAESFMKPQKGSQRFTRFIVKWLVSRTMPAAGTLNDLIYPEEKDDMGLTPRLFPAAFCDLHRDLFAAAPADSLIYLVNRVHCSEPMNLELRLGYDGPVKAWMDGRQMFHDPNGTNPASIDAAVIPWRASKGDHELVVAMGSNNGKAWGLFARFRRQAVSRRQPKPKGRGCTLPVTLL
ncbi:MAG: glycoside hydrolase family 20 zincin-like fold domain-containing protein [Kiritimatiellae bacterium]|nr:glycoside hydrolase family 20 zincin-like fold domain-containing protein [Kiritimatiellia bacterium]